MTVSGKSKKELVAGGVIKYLSLIALIREKTSEKLNIVFNG